MVKQALNTSHTLKTLIESPLIQNDPIAHNNERGKNKEIFGVHGLMPPQSSFLPLILTRELYIKHFTLRV